MTVQTAEPVANDKPAAPTWRDLPVLLPWTIGLIVGIALDRVHPVDMRASVALMTLLAALLFVRRVRTRFGVVVALLASVCCGALLHHRAFRVVADDDIVQFTAADAQLARVRGTVIDEPRTSSGGYAPFEPWLFRKNRTTFQLAVEEIESADGFVPASGRLRVNIQEAALRVRAGARVEAFGWLRRPRGPRNPGGFDWALFQVRRGVRAELTCDRAETVRILDPARAEPWWSRTRWRAWARRLLLDERLERGGPGVSVLDAMVLGRRSGVDRSVERAFIDTGCAHYLAVSGLHVGMLALAIWLPGRLLGWTRRRTACAVMALVVAYALIVDPRPPILRSAVMVVAYGVGIVLRRPRALVATLCLAALIVLVADPLALFDVGFQLSFVSVAGIIALQPVFANGLIGVSRYSVRRMRGERPVTSAIERIAAQHASHPVLRRWVYWATAALALALAAWACALPIVAHTFGRMAPWGWFNSWLAFPLAFVVVVLGFVRLAMGALVPWLGALLDPLLNLAVAGLLGLLEFLPQTNWPVPPPSAWLVGLYYLVLALIAARVRGRLRTRWIAVAALVLAVGSVIWWRGATRPPGVRVTFLAVGRGTSAVIELPDGHVWLYDAGASGNYDPGKGAIVPYLHERGIRRVTGIILSHPNLDHFGGVPTLVDALPCGAVYVSPHFRDDCPEDSPCNALLDILAARKHPVVEITRDDVLELGDGVDARVLWPPPDASPGFAANDHSLVLHLRYGETSLLFTGDVGQTAERRLLNLDLPKADVLELPHHGAVVPDTRALLDAVGAQALVRSSFVPMAESAALRTIIGERSVFDTADVGAVEVLLDGDGVRVSGYTASGPEGDTALFNAAESP